jgi:hypothetical protein
MDLISTRASSRFRATKRIRSHRRASTYSADRDGCDDLTVALPLQVGESLPEFSPHSIDEDLNRFDTRSVGRAGSITCGSGIILSTYNVAGPLKTG